jgi:hypothetical protein
MDDDRLVKEAVEPLDSYLQEVHLKKKKKKELT